MWNITEAYITFIYIHFCLKANQWHAWQTDDDVEAYKVAVAKHSVHVQHTKTLLKARELREAEDKKAQLLKDQHE